MPRTKLGEVYQPKTKKVFTLSDIPGLPTSLTVQQASKVSGIGYQSIRTLIENGKVSAIKLGKSKYVLPTRNFIIDMGLLPEPLLEKIYMQQMENQAAATKETD